MRHRPPALSDPPMPCVRPKRELQENSRVCLYGKTQQPNMSGSACYKNISHVILYFLD